MQEEDPSGWVAKFVAPETTTTEAGSQANRVERRNGRRPRTGLLEAKQDLVVAGSGPADGAQSTSSWSCDLYPWASPQPFGLLKSTGPVGSGGYSLAPSQGDP